MAGLTMKIWEMGGEPPQRQSAKPKLRLERTRAELPRGGKDMAAQIGAELRAVFALPTAGSLANTDELLARLDAQSEDR
ncbi:hypothetical protein [uncultured Methylovirgula sp.]|uniref:hypothetical protein n=1 Tax=uncultured Methylovirgula sp. TaxID=1285960 RepID=UPI00261301FC|nr:hypothetical protein [uncultured Methylovirgula sp.]